MSQSVLLIKQAGVVLALPASAGREVFRPLHLLPLPRSEDTLLGLTEVRGRSVPVIHPAVLTAQPDGADLPVLALLIEWSGTFLALPVDEVLGVVGGANGSSTPALLSAPQTLGDYFVQLLNLTTLLNTVKLRLNVA